MKKSLPFFGTRKSVKVKKSRYVCNGGPFDGEKLYLTDGATAVMAVNGFYGRYVDGNWENVARG